MANNICNFPTKKQDRDDWTPFDRPFIWPTAEINEIANRYTDDNVDGHEACRLVADVISKANDGAWKIGGKWFAMNRIIPKRLHRYTPSSYGIAGMMMSEGNVIDHALMIRGRTTRPGRSPGWMAPAGIITMPYRDEEKDEGLRVALMEEFPGCQALIPKHTVSWWYPGHTRLGLVLRPDVEFRQILKGSDLKPPRRAGR